MTLPTNSVAPETPLGTSTLIPLRSWFAKINDWIRGLSPSGSTVYDTGWVPVAQAPGYTTPVPVQARRIGRMVYWRGSVARTAGWTTTYATVVPLANFPPGTVTGTSGWAVNGGSTSAGAIAAVNSAGLSIACNNPAASVLLNGVSYPV